MRASKTSNGMTLRVIAGVNSVIIAMDLEETLRKGCLGFSIQRTDVDPEPGAAAPKPPRWLPNMLRFPTAAANVPGTTEFFPLQKFRWGDYTTAPGCRYRYRVVPRHGSANAMTAMKPSDGVEVEVTTEDNAKDATGVFFNRGAAASNAFNLKFPAITTETLLLGVTQQAKDARAWLSRNVEETIIAYLGRAKDATYAIHAAIYEFQKESLLRAVSDAKARKVNVTFVYHHRQKMKKGLPDPADTTASKNDEAITQAGIGAICKKRAADPQDAIMHDKFVVLLKDGNPQAVLTGSTNWTDGGIYGQLNVAHIIGDPAVAAVYEQLFQQLQMDPDATELKHALGSLTRVPLGEAPAGITPIFSPQSNDAMLQLYAHVCAGAKCLMVAAPFELHESIRATFRQTSPDVLHYLLVDKTGSLGNAQSVDVIEGDPSNLVSAATTLPSPLHDFQGKLLEGKESFHHAGVHIHSKIILADPFGTDPILVTGSANFSSNSTTKNDSNSLVIRGNTAVADIYATEFMRVFEHYNFRGRLAAEQEKRKAAGQPVDPAPLALKETDAWSLEYFQPGTIKSRDRRAFAGTA